MAQKIIVQLVDDLNGGKADETVTFELDGAQYEIDLSTRNAKRLRKQLTEFVEAARPVSRKGGGRRKGGRKGKSTGHTPGRPASLTSRDAQDVRVWARKNGHIVADIGRLPEDVVNAYYSRKRTK